LLPGFSKTLYFTMVEDLKGDDAASGFRNKRHGFPPRFDDPAKLASEDARDGFKVDAINQGAVAWATQARSTTGAKGP
jgi:hypothetical protein